ncbi:MAG: hypothetical protein WC551_00955 [Patescibacteria group bacterium]
MNKFLNAILLISVVAPAVFSASSANAATITKQSLPIKDPGGRIHDVQWCGDNVFVLWMKTRTDDKNFSDVYLTTYHAGIFRQTFLLESKFYGYRSTLGLLPYCAGSRAILERGSSSPAFGGGSSYLRTVSYDEKNFEDMHAGFESRKDKSLWVSQVFYSTPPGNLSTYAASDLVAGFFQRNGVLAKYGDKISGTSQILILDNGKFPTRLDPPWYRDLSQVKLESGQRLVSTFYRIKNGYLVIETIETGEAYDENGVVFTKNGIASVRYWVSNDGVKGYMEVEAGTACDLMSSVSVKLGQDQNGLTATRSAVCPIDTTKKDVDKLLLHGKLPGGSIYTPYTYQSFKTDGITYLVQDAAMHFAIWQAKIK